MRFTSKQIVTLVVALSAAAVMAPVTVATASGQLVTIVDKLSGKSARVSTNGALLVENRAYAGANAFNTRGSIYQFGWIPLASTVGPTQLAITDVTLSGPYDSGVGTAGAGEVYLLAYVRTSGTAACTAGAPGYQAYTLRHVWVPVRQTVQLSFAGQPLLVPGGATGAPICFGAYYSSGTTNLTINAGASGYKFRAP